MKKLVYLMIGLLVMAIAACDPHHPAPSPYMEIGDILCSDGEVLHPMDWKKSGKEGVGVVFYVNRDSIAEGLGYAVYLKDIGSAPFTDSLPLAQGTSCNPRGLDGNTNTYALMMGGHSPVAQYVYNMWRYGQSAYIPSLQQLRMLGAAREKINEQLVAIGGTPLATAPDSCWYWSSTEVAGQSTIKAWLYSITQGVSHETPKYENHTVRPIITINN